MRRSRPKQMLWAVFALGFFSADLPVFSQSNPDGETDKKYTNENSSGKNSVVEYLSKFELDPWKDDHIEETLDQGIQSQKSIDSLIDFLNSQNPLLFKYPSLVFHSRSLHSATKKSPRVILSSENARTLIAFNSDSHQAGGNRLEVIQYDPTRNQYDFLEVREEANSLYLEKNPATCLNCHTNKVPIWDGYNSWPRFMQFVPQGDREGDSDDLKMAKMWDDFKEIAKAHPRYRHLNLKADENRFQQFGLERTTMGIQYWNLKRLADSIQQKDPERKYVRLISDAFDLEYGDTTEMETLDIDEAVKAHPQIGSPDDFIAKLSAISGVDKTTLQNEYQEILQRILEAEKQRYADQIALTKLLNGRKESPSTDVVVLAHVQLVLNRLGIDLRDYGLGSGSRNYDFATPLQGIADMNYWLNESRTKVTAHHGIESMLVSKTSQNILFTQCASCHIDGLRGPKLSFRDADELKLKLKQSPKFAEEILSRIKSTDITQRMPFGYPALQSADIKSVEDLLKNLEIDRNNCRE